MNLRYSLDESQMDSRTATEANLSHWHTFLDAARRSQVNLFNSPKFKVAGSQNGTFDSQNGTFEDLLVFAFGLGFNCLTVNTAILWPFISFPIRIGL